MAAPSSRSSCVDPVGLALVQVDGTGVHHAAGPAPVDGADERAVGQGDADLVARPAAQAHAVAWASPGRPTRASGSRSRPPTRRGADLEPVVQDQRAAPRRRAGRRPPPLVGVAERPLVGGAGQVGVEHVGVGRVDHRRLGRPGEDLVGVAHEPLVELVVAGDEDATMASWVWRPARPACCHMRGDGAGEPVRARRRRARRRRCPARARWWPPRPRSGRRTARLDGAPLGGEVAAAVGPHQVGQVGRGQAAAHLGGHQLGALAAAAEGDGAVAGAGRAGRGDRPRLSRVVDGRRAAGAGRVESARPGSTARRAVDPGASRRR